MGVCTPGEYIVRDVVLQYSVSYGMCGPDEICRGSSARKVGRNYRMGCPAACIRGVNVRASVFMTMRLLT